VLDAVHELFVEGQVVPTVEDVAARSGVSPRSVYRYFPDSRALLGAALTRRIQVAEPLWQLEGIGQGALDDRIERFVAHRLSLYETNAPTIRAALSLAHEAPAIAGQVGRRRQQLNDQTRRHFAAELAAHPGPRAEAVLVCLELLCQFESVEQLRVHRGLPLEGTQRTLVIGVKALLGADAVA
jgi:AcrR family transcriptional regulator